MVRERPRGDKPKGLENLVWYEEPDIYLTTGQVAEALGVHVQYVRNGFLQGRYDHEQGVWVDDFPAPRVLVGRIAGWSESQLKDIAAWFVKRNDEVPARRRQKATVRPEFSGAFHG